MSARIVATSTTPSGFESAVAALDVAEFLEAHVRAESGFGEHIAFRPHQLQRDLIGHDGRIAVRDVGERPGMHEGRRAFDGLHQIGHDGVLHQDRQRAAHAEIVGRDGIARAVAADHHAAQAFAHIA